MGVPRIFRAFRWRVARANAERKRPSQAVASGIGRSTTSVKKARLGDRTRYAFFRPCDGRVREDKLIHRIRKLMHMDRRPRG
jgi:hypothetical protein